ncbi:MAG: O-acetyl-ADP-ribose deacetylase [Ignavibacteriaceae bacterium]|nr:macro domain-containing protein [Ignavibacteria bacterium]NNJ52100.1 O-acetyl-ADP-ribose deacetylase [Ignavibacteriaceae bacterium]NNL22621.1 O-acetyl-ADP-ribose deacetylase [Ignavibacteriaceae bacterium]
MLQTNINNSIIKIIIDDLTNLETEAIVFYAQSDLKLGSGFGNAIAIRGGASIQDELNTFNPISVTEAVITGAGDLKAGYIVHAVGPRFQEPKSDKKLAKTMHSVLKLADEKGIKRIAFPPMGTGFYGIPLDTSAQIMLNAISDYLSNKNNFSEVLICTMDNREYSAFEKNWLVKEKV